MGLFTITFYTVLHEKKRKKFINAKTLALEKKFDKNILPVPFKLHWFCGNPNFYIILLI